VEFYACLFVKCTADICSDKELKAKLMSIIVALKELVVSIIVALKELVDEWLLIIGRQCVSAKRGLFNLFIYGH